MLVCVNVINGAINQLITTGRSERFKRLIFLTAARKRYVSRQGFLFKKLFTQSPLQAREVCNMNFRAFCIKGI